MNIVKTLIQPPWRIPVACTFIVLLFLLLYQCWMPGKNITDGRHDLKHNGIWLQHGWLGDDTWFKQYNKNPQSFRNSTAILKLKQQLLENHITNLYPHVAPCLPTGEIAPVNPHQTNQFLELMSSFQVMPWVGGVLDKHVFPESAEWRQQFIRSIQQLLSTYPSLKGIHVNIEPLPSGYTAYLDLLHELKQSLPPDKILSIAAFPPPTVFQPSTYVHWDKAFFQQVSQYADQLVVMMYDTGLRHQKLYQHLMKHWAQEILEWSPDREILFGLPAYDDYGVKYHHPRVENLQNSLLGIHAALIKYVELPNNYKGIAIYCEWEMQSEEWEFLQTNYLQQ
jgi:Glycosyl hydrolases family 18